MKAADNDKVQWVFWLRFAVYSFQRHSHDQSLRRLAYRLSQRAAVDMAIAGAISYATITQILVRVVDKPNELDEAERRTRFLFAATRRAEP
jgi:hypothetical protein